jgi:hypothetical protein
VRIRAQLRSPLLAEETPDARLTFTGEELGDFCYDLQLKALPVRQLNLSSSDHQPAA